MKASELIRWALVFTDEGTARLVSDMGDAPLTPSTPGARGGDGNHALWCLGHQAYLEAGLPRIVFGAGREHALEHWAPLFAPGTVPRSEAGAYPSFEEVRSACRRVRKGTLALLEEVGEAGLDRKPAAVPAGFEEAMKTNGQTILLLAIHQMVHYGQITDARRVAGRRPLM